MYAAHNRRRPIDIGIHHDNRQLAYSHHTAGSDFHFILTNDGYQCLLFNDKHQYQHRRSYSHLAPLASPSAFCFAHRRPAVKTVHTISRHPHSPFSLLLATPHIFNSTRFLHPPHPTIRSPLYHGPFIPRYAHPSSSCVCVICCIPLYNTQAKDT